MEKIVKIANQDVQMKTSGAWAIKYKAQFGKDPIADIMSLTKLQENLEKDGTLGNFDSETIFNLCWSFAKNANPQLPPPEQWLESFDVFPVYDILFEIMDLITASLTTSAIPKNA